MTGGRCSILSEVTGCDRARGLLLCSMTVFACGLFESPTEPASKCPNPAPITFTVLPLQDPEPFVLMIDDRYELTATATRLTREYDLMNVEVLSRTHSLIAGVHPKDLDSLRCESSVYGMAQGRGGGGGPG